MNVANPSFFLSLHLQHSGYPSYLRVNVHPGQVTSLSQGHTDAQTSSHNHALFSPTKIVLFFFFFTVFQEKLSHIGHREMVQAKHRQVLLLDAFDFVRIHQSTRVLDN